MVWLKGSKSFSLRGPSLKRNDILAIGGLAVLAALALLDKIGAEAVVTFLGGLLLKPEAMEK